MRCFIPLTIFSAVTLTVAQSSIHNKEDTQYELMNSRLQSRDSQNGYRLQARSPVPGSSHSRPSSVSSGRHRNGRGTSLLVKGGEVTTSSPASSTTSIFSMTRAERNAMAQRLERDYAFKNMGLPPLRHTQAAPGLEVHGQPWTTLRSRIDPAHIRMSDGRVAAYEARTGPSEPSSSQTHSLRPKFSSGPAEMMVRYDVLQRNPGEPGYIAPSAFRASRVPEMSMISIPERKPPRQRESEMSFGSKASGDSKISCFGCFGGLLGHKF